MPKKEMAASTKTEYGVGHWMLRVLKEHKKAAKGLDADAIHDLRTALRRCLTIENALTEFDPHRAWKKMKRAAKSLLDGLDDLRDSQVLLEWLKKLEVARDKTGAPLRGLLESEQKEFKKEAAEALERFDAKKWKVWQRTLEPRANSFLPDSTELQYVALERWQKAFERHRRAMKSRSQIGYHRTRVALKRLRYTVEIFLPTLKQRWDGEPKELQTLLGEIHDLDVLWGKLKAVRPPVNSSRKAAWKSALNRERSKRQKEYAAKTSGENSAWQKWRASLPCRDELDTATLAKLGAWARFRTPDFVHAHRVADLSAVLLNAWDARGFAVGLPTSRARYILQAAALLEDAGCVEGEKAHHKNSYRLMQKLPPPVGWTAQEWQLAAVVARYHRKALPQAKHKEFSALPSCFQQATLLLSGILRLANAFEEAPNAIRRIQADTTVQGIMIRAYGFDGEEPLLSKLANAKHLLEIACGRPIIITPGIAGAPLKPVVGIAAPENTRISAA